MNLFGVMQISASGLRAQRIRAEVVAANMANAETTRAEDGRPYQRASVVFTPSNGETATALAPFGGAQGFGLKGTGVNGIGLAGFGGSASPAGGVEVSEVVRSNAAPLERYDPGHPDADANGYVAYPDINPVTEMVDLLGASRSYGLNANAVQAEKGMLTASLDLLK